MMLVPVNFSIAFMLDDAAGWKGKGRATPAIVAETWHLPERGVGPVTVRLNLKEIGFVCISVIT